MNRPPKERLSILRTFYSNDVPDRAEERRDLIVTLKVGTASTVITPELGTQIQGAGIPDQPARTVRDELEANALLLSDGAESVLLVSCDLAALPSDYAV